MHKRKPGQPHKGWKKAAMKTHQATRTVLFFREGFFYPIQVRPDEDLGRHAELNPGTLRIEDLKGNVLWQPH